MDSLVAVRSLERSVCLLQLVRSGWTIFGFDKIQAYYCIEETLSWGHGVVADIKEDAKLVCRLPT